MSGRLDSRSVSIRLAHADDWEQIAALFSQRDTRSWDVPATRWILNDLEPSRCLAWLALEGDRAVGFSSVFLRQLLWQGQAHQVGYWHNLYVDPDYRQCMLYPRLPWAMFAHFKTNPVAFLYAAVRRQDLVRAHLAIGFRKCGQWPVLMQLLRPFRLLAKHRGLGRAWQHAALPTDAAYGLWRWASGSSQTFEVRDEPLVQSGRLPAIVALLNQSTEEYIAQQWSEASFRERYRRTVDQAEYRLAWIENSTEIRAALIYRVAVRGDQIQVAVIMEIALNEDAQPELDGLLGHLSWRAHRENCELVLAFGGTNGSVASAYRRAGFRVSPEKYDLLLWPAQALTQYSWCADLRHWRFAFGDHDAF
jgi:hypothetical protein